MLIERRCTLASYSHGVCSAVCQAASASAAACEAFCCKGPIVTSAPAEPLKPVTGPCGQWQWQPSDLNGHGGCWVSVDPSLQKLPYSETGEGPWVGAEGNLGPGGSWGTTLVLVFLVMCALYITVFGSLNYRRGLRGLNALPHRTFWGEIWGLVNDGVQLSSAKLRGERGRRGVQGGVRQSNSAKGPEVEAKEKKKHKKNKREPLSKSLIDTTARSGGASVALAAGTARSTETPVHDGEAGAAGRDRGRNSGTAAGDGGRWVHVPG